eukprot:106966_1
MKKQIEKVNNNRKSLTSTSRAVQEDMHNINIALLFHEVWTETCIKFPFDEFEDFYLHNKSSPEFSPKSQFTFTNLDKYTDIYHLDDEKTLDFELFGADLTPKSISCDTPKDYILNSTNYFSYNVNPYPLIQRNFSTMDISYILKLKLSIFDLI